MRMCDFILCDEQARKKQELLDKKAQSKALLEEELNSIKPASKQPAAKITQAHIQNASHKSRPDGLGWLQLVLYPGRADKTRALPMQGRRGERGRANSGNIIAYCDSASDVENEKRQLASVCKVKESVTHIEKPLEENINRIQVEGDEARSVEEAIAVLSVKDPDVDRHPEKRLKAAYTAFEEANMPRIKSENPTLRLSQLKQILRKDWMKSPENPLNQRFSS
uniref:Coiled-coil domain-containing protein n=1 Tax=Timema tahoe TaxID=61484 RepID=A0A7R9IRR9_9NEOP|nr:unnamed protein product [Timema tahoe]